MGSINPVLLLPEALKQDHGQWAKTIAQSVTLGSGQFCTNPGLLLAIKNPDLERFSETLSEEIKAITPSSMLHPHIARKYEDGKSHMEAQPGISKIAEYRDSVPTNFARPTILRVSSADFKENPNLHKEVFGPYSLLVECTGIEDLEQVVAKIEGQLTASLIGTNQELNGYERVIRMLRDRVGRLIFNGVPTGVEVCAAMQHGGPYPATTDSRFTAVGVDAIKRWLRPVSFQNCPDTLLPMALRNANPLKLERRIDGVRTKANIG